MEKYTGKDRVYRKDFAGWAKVAEEVERRERRSEVKCGAVYWCNIGMNIGSSEDGKGKKFTRPVLVLAKMNSTQVLIIPITTQKKDGANYREIYVNARVEYLLFDQIRTVDAKCLTDFIDEVGEQALRGYRTDLIRILRFRFYEKTKPLSEQ